MKRRDNLDVAQSLLHRACEDEQTIALIANANGPWSVGCFHCQQAAEKRLKALLAIREGHFPRTHDIGQLIELAEPGMFTLREKPRPYLQVGGNETVGMGWCKVTMVAGERT